MKYVFMALSVVLLGACEHIPTKNKTPINAPSNVMDFKFYGDWSEINHSEYQNIYYLTLHYQPKPASNTPPENYLFADIKVAGGGGIKVYGLDYDNANLLINMWNANSKEKMQFQRANKVFRLKR